MLNHINQLSVYVNIKITYAYESFKKSLYYENSFIHLLLGHNSNN